MSCAVVTAGRRRGGARSSGGLGSLYIKLNELPPGAYDLLVGATRTRGEHAPARTVLRASARSCGIYTVRRLSWLRQKMLPMVVAPLVHLALSSPPSPVATVGLFELFELRLSQQLPFKRQPRNPFNFSECRVWASFSHESPDRDSEVVDGFYMTDFRRSFVNATVRYAVHEQLTPTGPPAWYVRWSPRWAGKFVYQVFASCADQSPQRVPLKSGTLQATANSASRELAGFVEAGPNRRHFRFGHSGRSFVPVGQDIAWPTVFNGSFDSDN